MIYVVIGVVALVAGIVLFLRNARSGAGENEAKGAVGALKAFLQRAVLPIVLIAIGLLSLASTSFVFVDQDQVGHLKRVYGFSELPPGRIVALDGQKGPQADILGPGFHFIPLVRVMYEVEEFSVVDVPAGFYGEITALDGSAMPEGMFIAPVIADEQVDDMLTASSFLTKGGYKGPQETVLKPGRYRLNRYLFLVRVDESTRATEIPAGFVGVVKSNVARPGIKCIEELVTTEGATANDESALRVALVPRGCQGLWKEPLLPGAYYLNNSAYQVTLLETRVKSWEYRGGYVRRSIDLSVDQEGNIKQSETSVDVPVTTDAVDRAVFAKIEGWDIPIEMRAQVQVNPENAPIVVGSVGGIEEVEHRVLTPIIRSVVRNVTGGLIKLPKVNADGSQGFELRPTRVTDLIDNRDALENEIEELMKIEGRKAGVEFKELRIGEPVLPPELLTARKRVQLANEFSSAYERETAAQLKRIEREKARATADEQPRLVESQIAVQVAGQKEDERAALGRAERQFLEELARGQRAQADVLGQDRVALLQALEKVLAALEKKPELVQLITRLVPNVVVNGSMAAASPAPRRFSARHSVAQRRW